MDDSLPRYAGWVRRIRRILVLWVAFTAVGCAPPGAGFTVDYYVDRPGSVSRLDLQSLRWTRAATDSPSFGFQPSTIWLRILRPPRDPSSILEVQYALLDELVLFARDGKGVSYSLRQGDLIPFAERPFPAPTFVFPLREGTGELFLKVRSTSSLLVSVRLHTPQSLFQSATNRNILFGVYFGFLILMAAYNLLLLFSTGDSTFGAYSAYVGLTFLTFFTLEGYSFQYLWPGSVRWNNVSFVFIAALANSAALEFTKRYLGISWENSRFRFLTLTGLQFVLVSLGLLVALVDYRRFSGPFNATVAGGSLVILGIVFHSLRSGFRPARYFAIAWTIFLSGMVCFSMRFAGIIPDMPLTHGLVYGGSALEVLLLSLGLGDRINRLRRDREAAQRETLDQQVRLAESFARFVPRQFLTFLNRPSIAEVRLGDSVEKEMTILFSDIRSFTTLTEAMTPAQSFAFINNFLKRIGPVIRHNNGFIDKYIGDAIMALFPETPDDAVRASVEMRRLLESYNRSRAKDGEPALSIGIGIHTGSLMLGTIGEEERLEGTVISDNVNLASRLEGLSKVYGTTTIISGQTLFGLRNPEVTQSRIIDYVRVKGKAQAVSVVEVFEGDTQEQVRLKQDTVATFDRAVFAYQERRFPEAEEMFAQVQGRNPEDSVVEVYLNRIRTFREHGLPPDWDGVARMDSK